MLPGVDDGSDSMDTSLLMASMAAESGVETVIVTPHCNIPGEAANYPSRELLGRFMALREAIDELPEREKMTILLRFFKGLTQEQAARLLGVSQVQVSRLERRALEKLRASLSDGL